MQMSQTPTSICTRKYAQGSHKKRNSTRATKKRKSTPQQRMRKLQTRNGKTSASIKRATRSCFVGGYWTFASKPFVAKPFRGNAFTR